MKEFTNITLEVMGKIPVWLAGTLVRNGPVDVELEEKRCAHWFDGLAMLHAFSFAQGSVRYTNKFLRTDGYRQVFEKRRLDYLGFAQDPCVSKFRNFFTRLFGHAEAIPNANINVAKFGAEMVALTEIPLPVRFDPQTLETLGVFHYEDSLPHKKCWESAHPHMLEKESINYLIDYGVRSCYVLYKMESSSREILAHIPVKEPAYMHSFSVTENYAILTEYPLVVRPLDFLIKGKAFIHNFVWMHERPTNFIVIDRRQGKELFRCQAPPFFAFHHVNAYEEAGKIRLDLVAYTNADIVTGLAEYWRGTNPRQDSMELKRFTLGPDGIEQEVLHTGSFELPRINSRYDGKPYNFAYFTDPREPQGKEDIRPLTKIHMQTKEIQMWQEAGCYPGEPVFVATPDARDEDDGVILAVVLKPFQQDAFLLVLDAKTFQEVGRAMTDFAIPVGLHGQFFRE